MKFENNELELLKEFFKYKLRVQLARGKDDYGEWLRSIKLGFRQEFVCTMIKNNVTPLNFCLGDEIKHWARLYRVHQTSTEKWTKKKKYKTTK